MNSWLASHALALIGGYYVFSALVSGMPEPVAGSGIAYRWAYASLHVLAGDLSRYIRRTSV